MTTSLQRRFSRTKSRVSQILLPIVLAACAPVFSCGPASAAELELQNRPAVRQEQQTPAPRPSGESPAPGETRLRENIVIPGGQSQTVIVAPQGGLLPAEETKPGEILKPEEKTGEDFIHRDIVIETPVAPKNDEVRETVVPLPDAVHNEAVLRPEERRDERPEKDETRPEKDVVEPKTGPVTLESFLVKSAAEEEKAKAPEKKEPEKKTPPASKPEPKELPKKEAEKKPEPEKKPTPLSEPKKGQPLQIPESAKKTGDLSFLEGCWVGTRPEYYTKRIVTERFCFDAKGVGKRFISDPSYAGECVGATRALLNKNGVLHMQSEQMYCSAIDERWGASEMICRGEGEQTPCSWEFKDAGGAKQSYKIRFVRE